MRRGGRRDLGTQGRFRPGKGATAAKTCFRSRKSTTAVKTCFRSRKSPAAPSRAVFAPEKAPASAESEIRATAAAFVQAFDRGDARAVAALWTPDGSVADDSGTIYKGRPAIEAQYAELFKQNPGAGWKWR